MLVQLIKDWKRNSSRPERGSRGRVFKLVDGEVKEDRRLTSMKAGRVIEVSDATGQKWIANGLASAVPSKEPADKPEVVYSWMKLESGKHPGFIIHELGGEALLQDDDGQMIIRLRMIAYGHYEVVDRCGLKGEVPSHFYDFEEVKRFVLDYAYKEIERKGWKPETSIH